MAIVDPKELDEINCEKWALEVMNEYIKHIDPEGVVFVCYKEDLSPSKAAMQVKDIAERYEHDTIILTIGKGNKPTIKFCNYDDIAGGRA